MKIFSFSNLLSKPVCKRCEFAQVGEGHYGWLNSSHIVCCAFGMNDKLPSTLDGKPAYSVKVGVDKGNTTNSPYPYANTINTAENCKKYKPAAALNILLRAFEQPIPR